ncbi:MAG: helix-turn-helix transcriptional regulator [Planctomycetaceae bacterium]|nr:helix-turn-helix transcriptional regulator [Planctomycetaceae bacterium]
METMDLKDFPTDAFRAILNVDAKQRELIRVYLECSDDVQSLVRSMFAVLDHSLTTDQDRERAMTVIADALSAKVEKHGGERLDFLSTVRKAIQEREPTERPPIAAQPVQLETQEATFSSRLRKIMDEKNVTQEELAERIDCTQSAISKILTRNARPHRKTILKVARALNVQPTELWPSMEVAAILDSVNDFFADRDLTEDQAKSLEAASSRPPAKVPTRVLRSRKGK